MTDLKTLIQNEYQGITFDVQASQIISAYEKKRRKNVATITGATLCFMVILSVAAGMNPRAVRQFLNETGKMFSSILSGKINYVEVTESTTRQLPSELDQQTSNNNDYNKLNKKSSNKTKHEKKAREKNEKNYKIETEPQDQAEEPYGFHPDEINVNENHTEPVDTKQETEVEKTTEKPTEADAKKPPVIQPKPTKPKVVETIKPTTVSKPTVPKPSAETTQPITNPRATVETTKAASTALPVRPETDKPSVKPIETNREPTEVTSSTAVTSETEISSSAQGSSSTVNTTEASEAYDEPTADETTEATKPQMPIFKYELISDTEIKITECRTEDEKLVIPETIDGYTVRELGSGFIPWYCTVTEVVIPDTVTVIEEKAFKSKADLTTVKMSEGIEIIGESAFEGCKSLESIDLKNISRIDANAFKNCDSLTSVTIPESVVKIGPSGFQSCDNLKIVYLNADYEYTNIFSSAYTFLNCKNLEELIVGEGVTFINSHAFQGCTALKKIELPGTLRSIYDYAFSGCTALESLTLPEGLETIGNSAFYGCSSLNEVNLPESLKAVRSEAFYNCLNLKSVTIPKGTYSLDKLCFGYYSTDSSDVRLWNFTVRGYEQTAAWNYAFYNGFTFERIGEAPVLTVLELEKYFVMLGEGESCEIKYTVEFPVGKTEFTSSDTEIASVDENGVISANSRGTATINVTNNNVTKQFIVIVR